MFTGTGQYDVIPKRGIKMTNTHLFEEFYNQLYAQYLYLSDGGTSYRIETSKLALEIAKKEKDIEPFLDRDQTIKVVLSYFSNLDEERLQDVSKMLYLKAKSVKRKNEMSDEMKKEIEKRIRNKGPFKLTKVNKDKDLD